MKKSYIFLFFAALLCVACNNSNTKNKIILSDSSGLINHVSVVIPNQMWEGEVGEALRKVLAAPVDGLPQEEPLFSLNQMPPEAFKGFVKENRLYVEVHKGAKKDFKILNDPFAHPQTGILIMGENNQEIVDEIQKNSEKMVKEFKKTEIKEKQRRIKKSLKDDSKLENQLGVSLKFPSAYRYAIDDKDFFWIRKDIPKGNMEIMVYQVPLNTIDKDTSVIANIIHMRDSIGEAHIPGPVEGSYMITEDAYAPYLFRTKIDGHFAYETKGIWEVKNAFMAGPFINYAVRDTANNRYVIFEGFAFSPATAKRDNMFELEAILQSAKIKE
ncbi:MAG: DUF4837 family protein [Gillisia sp.]